MRVLWLLLACLSWSTLVYAVEAANTTAKSPDRTNSTAIPASSTATDSRKPEDTPRSPSSRRSPETTTSPLEQQAIKQKRNADTASVTTANTQTGANPILTGINSNCVRSGDFVIFRGQNLTSISDNKIAIKHGNEFLDLQIVTVTNTQIVAKIPSNHTLKPSYYYSIFLREKPQKHNKTTLKLSICANNPNSLPKHNTQKRQLGELLILSKQALVMEIKHYLSKHNFTLKDEQHLTSLKQSLLIIDVNEVSISETMTELQQQFPTATIDFNTHFQPSANPRLYAADKIAWPKEQACQLSSNLRIGILDGLVDTTHPAFNNLMITTNSFLDESAQPEQQHGTAIAAILAGNNKNLGYQGLLTKSHILGATVLRQQQDQLVANADAIIRGVDWLMGKQVRLVNISLSSPSPNRILSHVISTAINSGLILFSAAGNSGKEARDSYPAAYKGVFAITAIDAANRIYTEANQGDYIDFSAPGVDLWLIKDAEQGHYGSGTSFASPHALAIAALFINQNPSLSANVLYNAMKSNVIDLGQAGKDSVFGWGLIQAPQGLCAISKESN